MSEKLRSYLDALQSTEGKKWQVSEIYLSDYQGQAENTATIFLGHQSEV